MAEQSGEKTQDATPHRRQQAREQGQVAYSQDLGSAALLVASVLLLRYWGGPLMESVGRIMRFQLGVVGPLTLDRHQLVAQSQTLIATLGKALLPVVGLLAVAGVLVSVFQTGLLFVPQRLMPDIQRLSLIGGFKRIVSLSGAVRLGFGLFKVSIVSIVAAAVLYQHHEQVIYASSMSAPELAKFLLDISLSTALWVGIALFILAVLDFGYQKWKHEQDLRMTSQEVREEMKNLQGDPQVIARRRAVQRQMALNRMGDKVPQADVVVTNPTELAIAIEYQPETMNAPVVVAKGAGLVAQRIRRLALENNVPIVERKPLAQLLYKQVEVGHPIPDESYAAVAEVLAYVYQLKGKQLPVPPQAA